MLYYYLYPAAGLQAEIARGELVQASSTPRHIYRFSEAGVARRTWTDRPFVALRAADVPRYANTELKYWDAINLKSHGSLHIQLADLYCTTPFAVCVSPHADSPCCVVLCNCLVPNVLLALIQIFSSPCCTTRLFIRDEVLAVLQTLDFELVALGALVDIADVIWNSLSAIIAHNEQHCTHQWWSRSDSKHRSSSR